MSEYPNLKGVATQDLVSQVQAGSYSASYINWARTCAEELRHGIGPWATTGGRS